MCAISTWGNLNERVFVMIAVMVAGSWSPWWPCLEAGHVEGKEDMAVAWELEPVGHNVDPPEHLVRADVSGG